jgi:hypothetical protein
MVFLKNILSQKAPKKVVTYETKKSSSFNQNQAQIAKQAIYNDYLETQQEAKLLFHELKESIE